ncbi:MAG: 5'-nucleotidase C-terminal domain-containing protein [Treponema sp.]|nr:5'-nucleotidase C-terminal domain-containing protein [Treponema sp.]
MEKKRKTGIVLISALLLGVLAFTGCPTESDPEPGSGLDWGKSANWQSEGDFELGTAAADIDGTNGRYQETALGNLIADGIAEYARYSSGEKVDFALHNGQDLKATKLEAGKITNTQVYGTIGNDTLYLVTYTGAEVTTLINTFVNSSSGEKWSANCVVLVSKEVSYSVTLDSDTTKPPKATKIKVNGTDIDTEKTYLVAVGNFIGATLATANRFPEGTDKKDLSPTKLSEAVAQYIYIQGTITPQAVDRITGEVPVISATN